MIGRTIVQEIEYPEVVNPQYLEQMLDTLPIIGDDDPKDPEWRATPIHEVDLTPFGYDAKIYVKDEADKRSNPTGTFKDRRAHENGPVRYSRFFRNLWKRRLQMTGQKIAIPRFSNLTAGNAGRAQAVMNERFGLPPEKLLLDIATPEARINQLMQLHADIYLAPLDSNIFTGKDGPYTPQQILKLTNNVDGHDITSSRIIDPQKDYYDWHWHEIFNESPDEVYGPYGSAEWFANGMTWQKETANNIAGPSLDARLRVDPKIVLDISIFAAEPEDIEDSEADKLTGMKPFVFYRDNDVQGMKALKMTGADTGKYSVSEGYLHFAHSILSRFVDCEVSAAAGLALFLKRYDQGLTDPRKKVLIVNTGKGI